MAKYNLLAYVMPNSSQIQNHHLGKRKAEILFVLKCIVSNWSTNSIDGMSQLFQCMFTDSERANDFPLSSTKMTYIINFCIALYFHQLLIDELKNCIYYSLSFNESFMILRKHVKWI